LRNRSFTACEGDAPVVGYETLTTFVVSGPDIDGSEAIDLAWSSDHGLRKLPAGRVGCIGIYGKPADVTEDPAPQQVVKHQSDDVNGGWTK
jgi:hypothetical protein